MHFHSLFDVIIYHDYFLDKGLEKFNAMDESDREKQIAKYNLSELFDILPSQNTRKSFSNFRLISRVEKDRIKVAVSTVPANDLEPLIPINENLILTFLVRRKSPDFQYFTDLDFDATSLLLLSNFVPGTEDPSFPLMKTEPLANPNDAYLDNDFFMNNATREFLANEFTPEEMFGAVAVVTIKMKVSGDTDRSVLVNQQEVASPTRKFIVQFNNKKYFWKFKESQNESVFRSSVELPLVKNGFIALNPETELVPPQTLVPGMDVPNPSVFSFEKMTIDSSEELCSVIYI